MGLESRRDWNGNILPNSILAKLHAGNAQAVANGDGGNDTNTLILIHIFAGGKKRSASPSRATTGSISRARSDRSSRARSTRPTA